MRVVVPGWFGVASVKWLERIVVSEKRFLSYFQSIDYSIWDRKDGIARMQPITSLQVKSIIAPAAGESLAANKVVTVRGAAWSGESDVVKVEFVRRRREELETSQTARSAVKPPDGRWGGMADAESAGPG